MLLPMAITPSHRPIASGFDLKAERVRHGLRAFDVAVRLGVSRVRVTNIEALHRVRPGLADRYLAALIEATDAELLTGKHALRLEHVLR